jgi:primosomal protein N' (replication factor Y)
MRKTCAVLRADRGYEEEAVRFSRLESTPRYHACDVAVMRARLENIPIILGSPTPSRESFHNAQRGQYTLLELPQRVLDRPLRVMGRQGQG